MNEKSIKALVYDALAKKTGPVSAVWLSKNLKTDTSKVKIALRELIIEKKIERVRGKLYDIPRSKASSGIQKQDMSTKEAKELLTGRIQSHPDGYAFFIPDGKGEDLFIPRNHTKGALDGDRVSVNKSRYRGRIEAHVTAILERGLVQIVGRIQPRKKYYVVIPFHRKFTQPVYIYRPTEKYAEDDIVVCRITKYPDIYNKAEGEIVSRLGHLDDKGIENIIVMSKYNLERKFPPEVLAEAEKAAEDLPLKGDNKGRFDLRNLYTVTVDGETARDFDDAISIEKHKGGISLYVHIADVSHYVKQGTKLDDEAYKRATSVYFPEFAIPMLPEALSNGVCSLNPDEDRFAMSVKIEYDSEGRRMKSAFYRSVIRSDRRLTYTYVNQVIDGSEKADKKLSAFVNNAVVLMKAIKERRFKNGSVDFDLPDVNFIFDSDGNIADIIPEDRGVSERVIEQFMIDANEAVAERLDGIAPDSIFRVHGIPDRSKIEQWVRNSAKLGVSVGKIPAEITPQVVQKWFKDIEDKEFSYMLKSSLVRSMQRAEYTKENIGHFGLASQFYTHFTSPIRRYPDLIVHRLMNKYEFKEGEGFDDDSLSSSASHCSTMERIAEEAEREVHMYKKLAYFKNHPDRLYDAYINRITSTGFYVFLTEMLMSGFVDVSVLPKGHYSFDIDGGTVYNRRNGLILKLGEKVDVSWLGNDMDCLEARFMLEWD